MIITLAHSGVLRKMNKKVMVVTPTYCTKQNQRLPLLFQSIYWVQQQTHKNFTHVIVDDGSTDETPEILDKIAKNNLSIIVYHKSNGGSSSAINYGINKALNKIDPDFITITHSDDILLPDSLENRVEEANKTNSKMVYSDMVIFYENSQNSYLSSAKDFINIDHLYDFLLMTGNIQYPTMLWDKDLFVNKIQGYDELITSAEDWDIALRTVIELKNTNSTFSSLNKVSAVYRIHDNKLEFHNIKSGIKWQCYKTILKKHLAGKDYQMRAAKLGLDIFRAIIPEYFRKPIRHIRDFILDTSPVVLPYSDEFMKSANKIDYPKQFIVK